jgi:hypothetical protein
MADLVKIEAVAESSARRWFADAELLPDPALVAEGWERRFTADAQRAEEAAELYSRLGYEVRLEPMHAEGIHDDCSGCHSPAVSQFKTIYTRRKVSP